MFMKIRPLPGVAGSAVLEALRVTEMALQNVRGRGGNDLDRLAAYREWSNLEVTRLGRLLSSEDLTRLVATPRYWALQTLDASTHRSIGAFVDVEVAERLWSLETTLTDLMSDLDRWRSRRGLVAMADTNVFLHSEVYFDQVPWGELLSARMDGVLLVIPMVVVDELDRAKRTARAAKVSRTNNEDVRTRARLTLRRLDSRFADVRWVAPIQPDKFPEAGPVAAELLLDEPGHVRLPDSDSELVDRASSLQDFLARPVHLLTFDTGMAFRARAAGLEVRKLEEPGNDD
jgi:hypothetical protein